MGFFANIFKSKADSNSSETNWDDLSAMPFDSEKTAEENSFNPETADLDDISELVAVMDEYRKKKQERFEGLELQYEVEQSFETSLTKVDDLMSRAELDDPEVSKRVVEYDGVEIPILTTKGCDLAFFQTDLNIHKRMTVTGQKLLEDPSFWENSQEYDQNSPEINSDNTLGNKNIRATANTVHTQYIDTSFMERYGGQKFFDDQARHTLLYVFDSVQPGSMVMNFPGFISVKNDFGDKEVERHISDGDERLFDDASSGYEGQDFLMRPEELLQESVYEQTKSTLCCRNNSVTEGVLLNEVVFRRYGDDGAPLYRPSAIFTQDGQITERHLRHAAYFGIPIINDITSVRIERSQNNLKQEIDELSSDSSYDDVYNVWHAYDSQCERGGVGLSSEPILNVESPSDRMRVNTDPIARLRCLEKDKRAEYIEFQIKKSIEDHEGFESDIQKYGAMTVRIDGLDEPLVVPAPKSANGYNLSTEVLNVDKLSKEYQMQFRCNAGIYDRILNLANKVKQ